MGKSETRVKKASKYCIAAGCFNNDKNSDCTFFAVPTGQSEEEVERCKKWLTLLGRDDMLEKDNLKKSSYCVCCAHFDDSQIKMLKTLRRGAVPTLLLADGKQEGSAASASTAGVHSSPGSSSKHNKKTSSQVKGAEMISSQNAEGADSNIEIEIKTEKGESLSGEEEELTAECAVTNIEIEIKAEEGGVWNNSSTNAGSAVSNLIFVKSEFVSTEEGVEMSTQTPEGLKKRKRTDKPKKKHKKPKGNDNK